MKKLFLILALAAFNASCASIVSDSKYPVTITSDPAGAHIEITDQDGAAIYSGNTPTTVTLPADAGFFDGQTYSIEASLAGHANVITELDSSMDAWYLANITFFGGVLGPLIIDPATGAMWELPKNMLIYLDPLEPSRPTATP